jgi:hypothetical protein
MSGRPVNLLDGRPISRANWKPISAAMTRRRRSDGGRRRAVVEPHAPDGRDTRLDARGSGSGGRRELPGRGRGCRWAAGQAPRAPKRGGGPPPARDARRLVGKRRGLPFALPANTKSRARGRCGRSRAPSQAGSPGRRQVVTAGRGDLGQEGLASGGADPRRRSRRRNRVCRLNEGRDQDAPEFDAGH